MGFDKATVKFDVKEGTVLAVEGFTLVGIRP